MKAGAMNGLLSGEVAGRNTVTPAFSLFLSFFNFSMVFIFLFFFFNIFFSFFIFQFFTFFIFSVFFFSIFSFVFFFFLFLGPLCVGMALVYSHPVSFVPAFWSPLFFLLVPSSVDCACVAYSVGVLVARDVWLKML